MQDEERIRCTMPEAFELGERKLEGALLVNLIIDSIQMLLLVQPQP